MGGKKKEEKEEGRTTKTRLGEAQKKSQMRRKYYGGA